MENIQAKLKKKKGFTLIELIIVIAILGILALIAIPKFGSAQKDAKIKADIATAKTIADTTATLVAKGNVDLKGFKDSKLNGLGKELDENDVIVSELGNGLPISQVYKDKKFAVYIDEKDDVQVFVDKKKVYPTHNGYGE